MTNYVSICLRSFQLAVLPALSILLISNTASAERLCGWHLTNKKNISAIEASDSIDKIKGLFDSRKTVIQELTTPNEEGITPLLEIKKEIETLLTFSISKSSQENLEFQRQQSQDFKNFMHSKYHEQRNNYDELFKLTGTLILMKQSENKYAEVANLMASQLTVFFSNVGLFSFRVGRELDEATKREEQLPSRRIERLKYNYSLILLADYGSSEAMELLKNYPNKLSTNESDILKELNRLKGFGKPMIDPQDEVKLTESGLHPGRINSNTQNSSWFRSLWGRLNN